jgi:hypothetical protein
LSNRECEINGGCRAQLSAMAQPSTNDDSDHVNKYEVTVSNCPMNDDDNDLDINETVETAANHSDGDIMNNEISSSPSNDNEHDVDVASSEATEAAGVSVKAAAAVTCDDGLNVSISALDIFPSLMEDDDDDNKTDAHYIEDHGNNNNSLSLADVVLMDSNSNIISNNDDTNDAVNEEDDKDSRSSGHISVGSNSYEKSKELERRLLSRNSHNDSTTAGSLKKTNMNGSRNNLSVTFRDDDDQVDSDEKKKVVAVGGDEDGDLSFPVGSSIQLDNSMSSMKLDFREASSSSIFNGRNGGVVGRRMSYRADRARRESQVEADGEDDAGDDITATTATTSQDQSEAVITPGAQFIPGFAPTVNNSDSQHDNLASPQEEAVHVRSPSDAPLRTEKTGSNNNDLIYGETNDPISMMNRSSHHTATTATSGSTSQRSNLNDEEELHLLEAQLVSDDVAGNAAGLVDEGVMLDRARESILRQAAVGEVVVTSFVEENSDEKYLKTRMRTMTKRRRIIWTIITGIVVLVVAIGTGIGISLSGGGDVSINGAASEKPTAAPTHSSLYQILEDATTDANGSLVGLLDTESMLANERSPEYKAYRWMVENDDVSQRIGGERIGQEEEQETLIQRFVVATLYFEWTQAGQLFHLGDVFLSPLHVCDWYVLWLVKESNFMT